MRVIRIVYIVGAAIKLAHRHTDTQTHRQAVRYSGGTLACPSRRDKCPLALCSNDCYLLYWAGGCSPDITIIERTHSLTALSTQYSLRLFQPKEGRNILLIKECTYLGNIGRVDRSFIPLPAQPHLIYFHLGWK